jgi:hypothetical protein
VNYFYNQIEKTGPSMLLQENSLNYHPVNTLYSNQAAVSQLQTPMIPSDSSAGLYPGKIK